MNRTDRFQDLTAYRAVYLSATWQDTKRKRRTDDPNYAAARSVSGIHGRHRPVYCNGYIATLATRENTKRCPLVRCVYDNPRRGQRPFPGK